MSVFFVDTSFWIALALPRDERHREAQRILANLTLRDAFITSEFVMIEFLNHFAERGRDARRYAASFIRNLESDDRTQTVPVSGDLFERGLKRFERSHDKGWSLTDCTSFLIMESMELKMALAFDHHFEQAGFEIAGA